MKTIAVLGSTGSIGRQTLEVLRAHPELGRVGALCAHGNVELLLAQALAFRPAFVGIADEDAADALRPYLPEGTHLEVGPRNHLTMPCSWYIYICHVIYGKYFVYQFYFQFVKIWRRSRSRGYDNYYQC